MFIFTVWLLLSKEDEARALGLELKSCPCGKHCLWVQEELDLKPTPSHLSYVILNNSFEFSEL